MIDDENHPEMIRAVGELRETLALLMRRRPCVDHEFYRQLINLRDEHRGRWRLRGVEFPHLVIIGVPRLGSRAVELWRADLDQTSLRVKVVNFVKLHPTVTPTEVATALQAAYPGLKPGDLIRPTYTAEKRLATTDSAEARAIEVALGRIN